MAVPFVNIKPLCVWRDALLKQVMLYIKRLSRHDYAAILLT